MVCLAMALLQLLSYLSCYINPAKAWFMTIFGLLFVPLLAVNLILLVWGIVRRSRSAFIPALTVILSLFILGRFVQFGGKEESPGDKCTVVTYNVGRFAQDSDGSKREEVTPAVMEYLASLSADIICLQEFYLPNSTEVEKFVLRYFPGFYVDYFVTTGRSGKSGNLTISRYPSVGRGVIDFKASTNLAVYSDYSIGNRTVRVYNCHFESYNISLSHILMSSDEVTETEHKMERAITQRPEQVNQVLHDIEKCSIPAIVAGDFNDNPMSYTYNRLVRGRQDSFKAAGTGFGATFRDFWPMLRIDYVLYPDGFSVCGYTVDRDVTLSDHYPVITKFEI